MQKFPVIANDVPDSLLYMIALISESWYSDSAERVSTGIRITPLRFQDDVSKSGAWSRLTSITNFSYCGPDCGHDDNGDDDFVHDLWLTP